MNTATMAAMMLPSALPAALRAGDVSAAALLVAAGLHELTPLKRACRRHCRERVGSGLELALWCLGSSLGLMAAFVALGVMGAGWMAVLAAVLLAQKLLPPATAFDVPLALGIIGLGALS